jgi:hypothetical protein
MEYAMTNRLAGLVSRIQPGKTDDSQKIKQVKGREGSYVLAISRKKISK